MLVVKLKPRQSGIFGYGSLLSIKSMERTFGRPYNGPFVPCTAEGWRRSWDAAMPNGTYYADTDEGRMYPEAILYLNVRRDPGSLLNGVLFVVDEEELAGFDRREAIYDRVDSTDLLNGVVEGGSAYIYTCKPEYVLTDVRSPRKAAIRATYIQIVEEGLTALGSEFRKVYDRSSDPVPRQLVIKDELENSKDTHETGIELRFE